MRRTKMFLCNHTQESNFAQRGSNATSAEKPANLYMDFGSTRTQSMLFPLQCSIHLFVLHPLLHLHFFRHNHHLNLSFHPHSHHVGLRDTLHRDRQLGHLNTLRHLALLADMSRHLHRSEVWSEVQQLSLNDTHFWMVRNILCQSLCVLHIDLAYRSTM